MKKVAIVFPGQGSQYLGMLEDYYKKFSIVRETFSEANDVLGLNLWKIIQENEKKLNQTQYTQPALLASSFAIWKVLQTTSIKKPQALAGHSLGEYSALTCAGAICFSDAISLVKKRGELMQRVVGTIPCAMSAILGLSNEDVLEVCNEVTQKGYGIVEAANFNTTGQVVISGEKIAVEKANEIARMRNAKRTYILPLSVASHCYLMKPASDLLAEELSLIKIKTPAITVFHNFDVKSHEDGESIKKGLVQQLYSPVLWVQTIQKLAIKSFDTVIECGPNKILTSLNKRISKSLTCLDSAKVISLDNFK
jgi:[acyl-carrier-protein] S-malonyltransferase